MNTLKIFASKTLLKIFPLRNYLDNNYSVLLITYCKKKKKNSFIKKVFTFLDEKSELTKKMVKNLTLVR